MHGLYICCTSVNKKCEVKELSLELSDLTNFFFFLGGGGGWGGIIEIARCMLRTLTGVYYTPYGSLCGTKVHLTCMQTSRTFRGLECLGSLM